MNNETLNIRFLSTPPSALSERNALLQKTLREDPFEFNICEEYPLVLSEKDLSFSYSLFCDHNLVAHANLWPRLLKVSHAQPIPVGLVGNVATLPELQGRGLMKKLFQHLEAQARDGGLAALILWSDLVLFYQKLGFQSLSQEIRFTFKNSSNPTIEEVYGKIFLVEPSSLDTLNLEELVKLRPDVPTLEREPSTFRKLLSIPCTYLFLLKKDTEITGYFILGKGADMAGVIHEWGGRDAHHVVQGIKQILAWTQWDYLLLLSPAYIKKEWLSILENHSASLTQHPMALAKSLTHNAIFELHPPPFIWGLDSI